MKKHLPRYRVKHSWNKREKIPLEKFSRNAYIIEKHAVSMSLVHLDVFAEERSKEFNFWCSKSETGVVGGWDHMHHHQTSSQSSYHCCTQKLSIWNISRLSHHLTLCLKLSLFVSENVFFIMYIHKTRKRRKKIQFCINFLPLCSFERFNFVSFF